MFEKYLTWNFREGVTLAHSAYLCTHGDTKRPKEKRNTLREKKKERTDEERQIERRNK